MMSHRRCVFVGALVALGACASSTSGRMPRGDRDNLFFADDDPRGRMGNLYELISRERPTWISTRGPTSFRDTGTVVVYRDGGRLGGPERLREIQMETVSTVQYLSATDAGLRFGLNHQHGAILVVSRKRLPPPAELLSRRPVLEPPHAPRSRPHDEVGAAGLA